MLEKTSIVLRQAFASMTQGDHLFAKALKWEAEMGDGNTREKIKATISVFIFSFSCAPIWSTQARK
jgi:hypothetical protein